jgi:hypothetical protein
MAKVVALHVLAVFGELLAEAEGRRTVKTSHETIDDGLGDQIKR